MAEYSASGVIDLPATSADSLQRGDPRVLGWIKEAIDEGDRIIRSDPSYDQIESALRYITGEQLPSDRKKLKYLPQVVINESRKAMQAHVSALTDLKPLFGWRTLNTAYQQACDTLNQYAVAEWVTTMADLELGDCIKYGLAAGTGDLATDWDPHAPLGGAHAFTARDPRDTLPIRPGNNRDVQMWQGLILREEHSVNALRAIHPTKAGLFRPAPDNVVAKVMGRFRSVASRLLTPADPLDQLVVNAAHTRHPRSGSVVLYRTYFRDRTKNLTDRAITLGTPGSAWAYVVQPGEPLYPRGRLVVSTEDACIYDGPNTYWHGRFPLCRLRLWSVPWQFLGIPLFNDLLPVQDAINDTVNDLRLAARQWTDPDLVYNRNAVSESTMKALDNRRPGKRVKVVPGFGDPYKKLEGPPFGVMQVLSELWDKLTTKHNDLSGTANLAALLQLRQLPSADTISKYYEALTPEIRSEARQVEAFMRDLAEMTKVNYFQFLSTAKRVQILGPAGVTLNDFDYDPNTMVPALKMGDPGYTPELDTDLTTRDQRAQWIHKQFVFVVAPNSILAMHSTERKMQTMQQAQMGYVDFWTFHDVFETPNVGAPPAIPLPPLAPVGPDVVAFVMAQTLQSVQTMMPPGPVQTPDGKQYILDPSGQILEVRVPTTITERLQAQEMLGIGMMANAQGRKATNNAPVKSETKNDKPGGRQTMTTSEK